MSGSDGDVAVLGNEMEAVVSPGSQPWGAAAGVNLDSIANGSRQLARIVKRRRCRGAETAVSPGVSRGAAAGVFCVSVADGSGPLARIVEGGSVQVRDRWRRSWSSAVQVCGAVG